jgi:aminoglycoside phosphotransferase (APT) family kinase protein
MPEQLHGGIDNAGKVVREGDVVLRPAPTNAQTLHPLFEFLASSGFPSPRPLGFRDDGREALQFIPGETSTPPYPHEWVTADETLKEIGRTLRALHDTTRGFVPVPDAVWTTDLADPQGGEVVCHNDVCIENVVISSGKVAGLLDFDFAAPGRPVWDLAMTARFWVPLRDPLSAAATNIDHLDPFERVRVLVDGYGANEQVRRDFTGALMETEEVALRFVLNRVNQEIPAFVEMWNDLGAYDWHHRKVAWLTNNRSRIDDALAP